MLKTIKSWLRIVVRLPRENQILRKDVERLSKICERLQVQRNMWQEMHRAAGVGYMASQDVMMKEIIRLSEKANETPDAKLEQVVQMYGEAHVKVHERAAAIEEAIVRDLQAVPGVQIP